MRRVLKAFIATASCAFMVSATVERDDSEKAVHTPVSDTRTATAGDPDPLATARSVGSWKNYIAGYSGWIEVDPATGKPLIVEEPQKTNLPGKPQGQVVRADS